jgi:hypothetical protein
MLVEVICALVHSTLPKSKRPESTLANAVNVLGEYREPRKEKKWLRLKVLGAENNSVMINTEILKVP